MSNGKDLLQKVEFKAGDVLFKEGEPAQAVFVINSGCVQLTKKVHMAPCQIETLGEGDVLGETAFFDDEKYKATAIAYEATTCLRIASSQFADMVSRSPDIALRILRKLAVRLVYLQFRLANFTLRTPLARVMHQLLAEAERSKTDKQIPVPFDLPEALAMERGAVDEMMRTLIRQAIITVDDTGNFAISDLEGFSRCLTYMELKDRFENLETS